MYEYLPAAMTFGAVILGFWGSYQVMGYRLRNIERRAEGCDERYVSRDQFDEMAQDMKSRLERIERKLDTLNNDRR